MVQQSEDKKGMSYVIFYNKCACFERGKISASWYNYAAHVTMLQQSKRALINLVIWL